MNHWKTCLMCAAFGVASLPALGAQIVINEVYGGGGNSGSTFKNDFIELYNNGSTSVDISGYRLLYASAAGSYTSTTDDAFATFVPASTTLAPGAYYLIQEAVGAGGTTNLPSPNLVDATPISMSGTTAKVKLTDPTGATILDTVAWGPTATLFEGTGPAPIASNTTSVMRIPNGTDNDNNAGDFLAGFPTPGAVNDVPEPASLAGLAVAGLLVARRRKA